MINQQLKYGDKILLDGVSVKVIGTTIINNQKCFEFELKSTGRVLADYVYQNAVLEQENPLGILLE